MLENSLAINLSLPGLIDNTTSQLRQEYQSYQNLLQAQPVSVREHFRVQAKVLTETLVNTTVKVDYYLPEVITVNIQGGGTETIPVPQQSRSQSLGSWLNRLIHIDMQSALQMQLLQLENSLQPALSISAVLLRHALVMYMVHEYLPEGTNVQYIAEEDDAIPSYPAKNQGSSNVEAASGFFLPGWVAFDDQNHLLASDLEEAQDHILAMKCYLAVLDMAVGLAPYIVVDDDYIIKRYGVLGQLLNQGRAFANYQVESICQTIKRRSVSHSLDRGFSLSIPYFNDQTMSMETYNFDIIPKGRVMFVPAFVVLAVRAEGLRVAQNIRLNLSTRKHLLNGLNVIERAFSS